MTVHRFPCRLPVLLAVAVAALWFAPSALAGVHVGIGVSVPGISVGSCWRCGYRGSGVVYYPPAPVYYAPRPVYYAPPPVYYAPRTVYYVPRPAYYGYVPHVRYHHRYHRGYRHHGGDRGRGHYYHRGHR